MITTAQFQAAINNPPMRPEDLPVLDTLNTGTAEAAAETILRAGGALSAREWAYLARSLAKAVLARSTKVAS